MLSEDMLILKQIVNNDDLFFEILSKYKKQSIFFPIGYESFLKKEEFLFLKEHLSAETLFEIYLNFKGLVVYFPESFEKEKERMNIYKDYLSGKNFKDIALKYNRTEDNIRKIIKKYKRFIQGL